MAHIGYLLGGPKNQDCSMGKVPCRIHRIFAEVDRRSIIRPGHVANPSLFLQYIGVNIIV